MFHSFPKHESAPIASVIFTRGFIMSIDENSLSDAIRSVLFNYKSVAHTGCCCLITLETQSSSELEHPE